MLLKLHPQSPTKYPLYICLYIYMLQFQTSYSMKIIQHVHPSHLNYSCLNGFLFMSSQYPKKAQTYIGIQYISMNKCSSSPININQYVFVMEISSIINQSSNQSMSHLIKQTINQSNNQSINQSINQLINQFII